MSGNIVVNPTGAGRRPTVVPTFPTDRHGLVRRRQATAADISDDQLAAAVAHGELLRLTRGVFVQPDDRFDGPAGRDALYRLRSLAVATSECVGERSVGALTMPLSHMSAAAMHGLSMLHPDLRRVHVTNGRAAGGSVRRCRHIHAATLAPDDIVVIDGIAVTSLERTAVDVAVGGDFAQALTVFDAALRLGADRSAMEALLEGARRSGVRPARRALPLADRAAESVGESWSRAQMIEGGLPVPRLQSRFRGRSGSYFSDFDWQRKLVGEFDGLHKYGRLLRPGQDPAQVVVDEKIREDELRELDVMVIRWTWAVLEAERLVALLIPRLTRLGLMP